MFESQEVRECNGAFSRYKKAKRLPNVKSRLQKTRSRKFLCSTCQND